MPFPRFPIAVPCVSSRSIAQAMVLQISVRRAPQLCVLKRSMTYPPKQCWFA